MAPEGADAPPGSPARHPPPVSRDIGVMTSLAAAREVGGQVRHRLTRDEQDLVDAREVDDGGQEGVMKQRGATVVDRADATDGDPARKDAAQTRGDDDVVHGEPGAV